MAHYCSDCCYMDTNRDKDYKFACINSRSGYEKVAANMRACRFFSDCFGYRSTRDKDILYNTSKYKRDYYIVSAICKILGLGRDNDYMNNFMYVRDVILPNLVGGNEWCEEYDEFGPKIAEKLQEEKNAVEIATNLKDNYLDIFVELMNEGNVDDAITVY